MLQKDERIFLERAVELAEIALEKGDEPFGSVLVSEDGEILAEDHNRVAGGDHTQHPEFNLARWAAENMTPEQRARATMYTSGEHCPMCAGAHGWVGIGRIVYASSSAQLKEWLEGMNVPPSPVNTIPVQEIIRNVEVVGPVQEFTDRVKELQRRFHTKS